MTRVEDDDQETCYWPVVVVGGGFVAMEAAAVIASKCDDLHVTVILNNDHFMGGKGGVFDKEMSEFYERQLSQRFGVRFARNYTVTGLWDKEEVSVEEGVRSCTNKVASIDYILTPTSNV